MEEDIHTEPIGGLKNYRTKIQRSSSEWGKN